MRALEHIVFFANQSLGFVQKPPLHYHNLISNFMRKAPIISFQVQENLMVIPKVVLASDFPHFTL
jgi:hypothetical protein